MKITNKRNINVIKSTKVNFKFKVKNAKLFKPLIWSTHTKLPLKLKLTKKGLLKGIAKKAGVFKIKIKVVNSKKQSVSKIFILNVKNAKPKPTTTTAAPTTTTPNPSGLNVYVANFGSDVVSTFERNISTGALNESSTNASGNNPNAICISVDGKNVYVTNYDSNTISMFDRDILDGSLSGTATIPTGTSPFANPRAICISVDGKNVYVATLHNDISIYERDIETGLLTENGTIDTEIGPGGICISEDGKNVYVTNSASDTVSIYDRNISNGSLTLHGTVVTGITETNPVGICISLDGKSVYVANPHSDTVAKYIRDVSTGALNPDGSINTQDHPEQICISEDGRNVYVTNVNSNTVSIFDRDILDGSLSGTNTIGTGAIPAGVCISEDGKNVYVTNATSNSITVYDRNVSTGALSIASVIETLINPGGICIYPTIHTSNTNGLCFDSWGVRGMIAEYDIATAITSDLIGFTRPTIYGLFYLSELDTYCITFSEEPVSGPFIYSVKGLQVGNTITLPDLWKDTIIGGPYPDVSGTYYVTEVKYNLTDSSENFFQEYAVLSCVPTTTTTTTTTSTTAAPNTFSCFSSWACPNGLYSRALITGLTSGATWQGYQGTFRSGGISLMFYPSTPPYFTDNLAEVPVTKQGTFMIDEEVVITGDNLVQTIDGVTYNWAGTFVYAANFGDQHYLRCVGSSPWNGIIPTANCQNTTTTTTTTTTPPQ